MNKKEFRLIIAIVLIAAASAIAGPMWSWAATSLPAGAIIGWNGTNFVATGTPQLTVGNLLASSTSATNVLLGTTGIGTTSPAQKLGVQGSIIASGDLITSNVTATGTLLVTGNTGIGTTSPWGKLSVNPNALGSGVPEFVIGSSTGTHFIVTGNGDIGLGTMEPGAMLHISAPDETPYALLLENRTYGVGTTHGFYVSNTGTLILDAPTVTGSFAVDAAGKIGIATTTPAYALDVFGDGFFETNLTLNGGDLTLRSGGTIVLFNADNSGTEATIYNASAVTGQNTLTLNSSGSADLTIDNVGKTGIATSSPYATLSVEQQAGTGDVFAVGDQGTSTPHFVIKPDGSVGIASTSPASRFGLVGNAMIGGNLTLTGNILAYGTLNVTSSGQSTIPNASSTNVTISNRLYTLLPASFSYSTTTAWAGTTTLPLGPAAYGETFSSVQCFTDAGTLNVAFTDGTNDMNYLNASTTVGNNTLFTNNTFTQGEKRYVKVGTPSSSPTSIACTVLRQPN